MKRYCNAWIGIACLAMGLATWLGACTRSAGILGTPVLPLAAARTQAALSQDNEPTAISVPTHTTLAGTTLTVTPAAEKNLPLYAVVFLAEGEVLNVRSGAGVTNDLVGSLSANAHDLQTTGKRQDVEGVSWVEIQLPDGIIGWVSGEFLTLQVRAPQFCSDAQVGTVLDSLVNAIRNQDGSELKRLASPVHGLTFQYHVWGTGVRIEDAQSIENLFTSTIDYPWWVTEDGETIQGIFKDTLLPRLEDVLLQSHSRHCNTLEQGVAAGSTQDGIYWPYDYRSLNYVALFRPAPTGDEQNWRTWVAGIEYVDDKPYIAVLLQFTY